MPTNLIYKVSNDSLSINQRKEISWTEKGEVSYTLVLNNESKTIDATYVDNIKLITFYCASGPFTVTMVHNANTIVFEVDTLFTFTPTTAFVSGLTELTIGNAVTEDKVIEVNIIGE